MAQTVDALFRQLQKDLQAEEFGNAVATADKVLKSNPKDADAIQIKTTALLKTNQFAAALQTAGDSKDLTFERAYALYRLNDYDKCKQLLAEVDSGDKTEGYQHLEAQLYYRMGDYSKAAELYESIAKSAELDPELVTNILAAYVSAGLGSKALSFAQSVEKKVEATHEIAYNRACAFIEAGDLATAAKWLETAKKSCQQALKADGASKEEIDDEMSVLLVQSAYLAQLKGDAEAALQLYTTVLGQKPSDQAVVATAANNSLSLKKNDRLFESQKRMDRALKVPVEKLSVRQRTTLRLNQSLLHVIGKKLDKAREEAEALHKQFPDDELPVLILATVAHREKNVPQAVQTLKDYIASHPANSVQSQLTLAHLSLLQGDSAQALSTLQSVSSIAHKPATVAVLVKLQEQQADGAAAVKTIEAALAHWESKKGQDPAAARTYSLLVEQAAAYFLGNGQHSKALSLYQKILSGSGKDNKDPRILSKLILASAKSDPAAASKYAAQLPALEGAAAVDVKSLEAISAPRKATDREDAGPAGEEKLAVYDPRARTKAAAEGKLQTDADAAAKAAQKRKKKKKKRLPKGFDPANPGPPPDPERWLPKWERSYNKKARKAKLKQQALRGAQGSTGSSDNLDASQGAVFNNEPKAAATAKASSNLPRNRRRRG